MLIIHDSRQFNRFEHYLFDLHIIIPLNHRHATDIAEFQHLAYQIRQPIGTVGDVLSHIPAFVIVHFCTHICQYMCETTQDIQRRTYFMRHLLNEGGLHFRRFFRTGISFCQLIVSLKQFLVFPFQIFL